MVFRISLKKIVLVTVIQFIVIIVLAQPGVPFTKWTSDGNAYYQVEKGEIVKIELPSQNKTVFIPKEKLTPTGGKALVPRSFQLSANGSQAMIYTNAKKVWRYATRGDYWLLNLVTGQLKQLGQGRPEASLQFAKFSPDGSKVAYVSEHNIYVEDLVAGGIKKITDDNGTKKLINGTFDWVYEEEFFCRDGFRWAPDGKTIAYWQIDANKIRDYYMLNWMTVTNTIFLRLILKTIFERFIWQNKERVWVRDDKLMSGE